MEGQCEGVQLIPIDKVADTSVLRTIESNTPYEVISTSCLVLPVG